MVRTSPRRYRCLIIAGPAAHRLMMDVAIETACADSGAALSPDTLVVQLPSYDLYKDWERTSGADLVAWPGGPAFTARDAAPILDESNASDLRRIDPETLRRRT